MSVPLSEDGSRFAWFACGANETALGEDPHWNPKGATMVQGWGYRDDGERYWIGSAIPVGPDPSEAFLVALAEILAAPEGDYAWI